MEVKIILKKYCNGQPGCNEAIPQNRKEGSNSMFKKGTFLKKCNLKIENRSPKIIGNRLKIMPLFLISLVHFF